MDTPANLPEAFVSSEKKSADPKTLIIFIIIVLVLGSLALAAGRIIQPGSPSDQQPVSSPSPMASDALPVLSSDADSANTIIYGQKLAERMALASAVNDSGKNNTQIAALQEELKFVIPLLNGQQLLYIGDVDATDKGENLKVKDIQPEGTGSDGKVTMLYTPSTDTPFRYRIDKLIISQNHEWIAWAENAPAGDSPDLHAYNYFRAFKARIGGKGRVDKPITPIPLTEEKSDEGVTIYLPAVITDSGEVYFDGIKAVSYFLHGGFTNETKQVILATNTYNSQPSLAQNRYLLYTSFNPNNNPQLPAKNSTSARLEVVNRNSVKVSDLQSPQAQPIIVAPGDVGEHYAHPVYISGDLTGEFRIAVEVFDSNGGTRLVQKEIQVITRSANGTFDKKTIMQVPSGESWRILAIGNRPNGEKTVIAGKQTEELGNLGSGWFVGSSGYQKMLSAMRVYNVDTAGSQPVEIPLTSRDEFLGVLPKTPSDAIGINRNELLGKLLPELKGAGRNDQLQLYTFMPVTAKRELVFISDPQKGGSTGDPKISVPPGLFSSGRKNPRIDCRTQWQEHFYPNEEICEMCPVYVYSNKVQAVTIKPKTRIYKASAVPALNENSWSFLADKEGNLLFPDNSLYKHIDFLFPRSTIDVPTTGKIIQKDNFSQDISAYAKSLGFNDREATDVVAYLLPEIVESPYIFLSHLSEEQTKKLLDVEVSPQPDVQETRIFYIQRLSHEPVNKPPAPAFEPIVREGDLTVVTWGGIVE